MKNDSDSSGNSLLSLISLKSTAFYLLFFFLIGSVIFSCKKTGPAEALITVVDTNNKAVGGATVVLKQDTIVNSSGTVSDVYSTKTTDSQGNAFFRFKWEAVLNVVVKKGNDSVTTYIRLEQSETVNKKVVLK